MLENENIQNLQIQQTLQALRTPQIIDTLQTQQTEQTLQTQQTEQTLQTPLIPQRRSRTLLNIPNAINRANNLYDNIITYDMDIQIEDERVTHPTMINSPSNNNIISRTITQQRRRYSRPLSRLYGIFSEVIDNIDLDELESIPIIPTQQQIDNAVQTIKYGDIEEPQNSSCSICLREFTQESNVSMIKYCGHLFSPLSLTRHWTFDHRCPLCRYDIRNYTGRNFNDPVV